MKPARNTEEFVRNGKPRMTTGPQMDRRILNDSFAAMEETLGSDRSTARRMVSLHRTIRYVAAAAAVLIVATTLLMVRNEPPKQPPPQPVVSQAKESPATMLSMLSLNMAYRRGGLEAVDRQSSRAFEMLESPSNPVSIQELLMESNGVQPERKIL